MRLGILPAGLLFALFATGPVFARPLISLQLIASGLESPVFLTDSGDASGRLFVLEQRGRIRILRGGQLLPQPFLDITTRVESGGEKGLLGLAFHPAFAENRRFFLNYTTRRSGTLKTIVAEYRASAANQDVAETDELILLEIDQPFDNHNGGHLAFGPDRFLYVATGDGGSAGDPQGNAQDLSSLLGKILRVDVDSTSPYAVPPDNPFAGSPGARPEIWAYGLRNPWRFSFDRLSHRLFAGDVGQNSREEVDIITRGGNYGWNLMEGTMCYPPSAPCGMAGLVQPIGEYGRDLGTAVTGGYVYRGRSIRSRLWGSYIFGDFGSGTIWGLLEGEDGQWQRQELLRSGLLISSFGEDPEGELYVVDLGGTVHRVLFSSFPAKRRRPRTLERGLSGSVLSGDRIGFQATALRKTRAGRVMSAQTRSSAPETTIPRSRKGKSNTQISG